MGVVCRNRSGELGSASIQTDGHGSEFPEAPGNPPWGTPPGPRLSSWMACLFVRTGSDLLHCSRPEQTSPLSERVHRVRPPAL